MNSGEIQQGSQQEPMGFREGFANYISSQLTPYTMLRINYVHFFWVFVIGAFLGIVVEAAFHIVAYGTYESRAGLIWGEFSPLYGVAAVILTLSLDRFTKAHNLFIFVIAAVEGCAIEFFASLLMQYSWGAIAWDYTGTLGSLGGRTNLFFAMLWGLLGLFWVHAVMPLLKRFVEWLDTKRAVERLLTCAMTVFLAVDIAFTWAALSREQARQNEIPAAGAFEEYLDVRYPDAYMDARFHNLTVMKSAADAQPSEDSYAAQRRKAQE